ncbi:hypothetical protein PRUPE_6G198900 [Prunus persica]|uniref:Uncharacterized protein n=1 Tax=Prunus persica TaxID=3760 RepID=A0A251NT11_PRUPE|nr:hypothetical protein PRUPE_6G198900 [Prunus persica]
MAGVNSKVRVGKENLIYCWDQRKITYLFINHPFSNVNTYVAQILQIWPYGVFNTDTAAYISGTAFGVCVFWAHLTFK